MHIQKSKINSVYAYITGPYNPYSQDCDQASHTTHVVCVNFKGELRNLQFKVDSERKFLWNFFMTVLFYSQSFCRKSVDIFDTNPVITNKPTHYSLVYGDFIFNPKN